MATPTKAITYLSGPQPQAPAPLQAPRPLALGASTALALRVPPPLWRPLRYVAPQLQARTVLIPRPLLLQALAGLKMTVFWRGSQALPLKGQRYPLSR